MVTVCSCLLIAASSRADVNRSFASIALAEPWWEMGKTEANITPGDYLVVRELPNMDALAVDSFDLLLRAETSFTNPKVDQQAYTGTFVNVSVELLAQQDRGVTVRQTLAKVSSPTNAASLDALPDQQMDKNEILDVFSLVTGEKDTRALQWKNIHPDQRATLFAIADSNLVSQFATGYLYADREFKKEDNGTATFSILFYKAAWDAWSGEDIDSWTFLRYGNRGRDRATLLKTWTGIAIDDADDALNAVSTNTNFITSGYAVTDAYYTDNKDESVNVIQAQTQTGLTDMASSTQYKNFDVETSKTDENMASAITHGTNFTDGEIVTTRNVVNEDGLNNHTYITNTATEVTGAVTVGVSGPLTTVASSTDINQTSTTTSGGGGDINTYRNTENEHGRWDVIVEERTGVAGTGTATAGGPLAGISIDVKRNQAAAPTLGSAGTGANHSVSASLNEFGKWDTREQTTTATAKTGGTSTFGGPIVGETLIAKRNQAAAPSPTAGAAGTINSASYSINEFGLYDTRESVRTSTAAVGAASTSGGPLGSDALTVKRNQNAVPSLGAGSAGTINNSSYSVNEFGRYDTRENVRTATAAAGAASTSGGPLSSSALTVKRNQSSVPALGAGSAGTINNSSYSINEFGRYDLREDVRTSTAVASASSTSGGPLVSSALTVKRNQTAVPSLGAGSAGTINDSSFSVNEFGRYDSRENVRTASAAAGAQITYGGPVVTEALTIKRNQTNVPSVSAGSAGTINSASYGINEFGLYDTRESTRAAVAIAGSVTTFGGPLVSETLTIKRNQSSVPSLSAGSAGTINSASYSINEFGRYDTRESARTSTADSTTVTYGGVFESSVETSYRNAAAPVSPAVGAAGVITRASTSVNDFGRYNGKSIASTSVTNSVSSFTSVDDEYGTTAQEQEYNAASMASASDTTNTEQSVSGRLNRFGKYDYTKTTRTAVLPTTYNYTLYGQYYWNYVYSGGTVNSATRRVRGWLYTITFHNNAVDAATAIAAGYKGSSVARMAVRVWRATKVTKGTDIDAGW